MGITSEKWWYKSYQIQKKTGLIETWSSRIGHGMGFKQQGCTAVAGLSSLLCHEFTQNVPDWRVPNIECLLGWRAPKPEGWTAASLEDFKGGKLSIKIIKADRRSRKLEIPGSYKWRFPESQADQRPRAVPADEVQQFCKAQGVRIWPFQLVKHDVFKMFKGSISILALDHPCIEYLSRCLQSDSSVGKYIMHGAYGRSRSYPFCFFSMGCL